MKASELPEDERERIGAVQRYHILDTEEEKDFNDIVELAAQLCNTPIALVTLVDENRQWFKARTGLSIKETHRNLSFCAHAIHQNDVMIVHDALTDDRFFDNPLVLGEPFIRFYAGMPLITTDGYKLGTLAVIDREPKELTEQQLSCLRILAKQVVTLLNLRFNILQRNRAEYELQKINKELTQEVEKRAVETKDIFERVSDAFVALDKNWIYTYVNSKAEQILSRPAGYLIGKHIWTEFPEEVGQSFHNMYEAAMATQQYRYQEEYSPYYSRWFENHIYPSPTGLSIYFRDITEKKEAELAVKSSEEKRRLIMNAALDAIICIDTRGTVTFWNPQAEKIFGWKEEEVMGRVLSEIIIPHKYREQHTKGIENFLKTGYGPRVNTLLELSAINRENTEFPIELTVLPIRQANEEFFCAFIRDISERKKAGQKIIQEKELSDSIINSLPGIFYLYDEHGKFIRWNKNFETVSGYSTLEVSTMHPLDFFDENEKELLMERIGKVFTEGMSEVEAHFLTKDRRKILYYFNGWRAKFQEIICLIGMGIDITERKKAEETTRQAEERYRSIFENALDGIYRTTPEGRFIAANSAMAKMFGYNSSDELIELITDIGTQVYVNEDDRLNMQSTLETYGSINGFEAMVRKKDGNILWARINNWAVRDSHGKIKYHEGTLEDITERKVSGRELERSVSVLKATLESTADGILVADGNGNIVQFNKKFAELWRLPDDLLAMRDDDKAIAFVLDQLISPESFLSKVKELYSKPDESSFDVIAFKDGRTFERYSQPQTLYEKSVGRVWSFRDITERKTAEEKLKKQFEELQKINSELDHFVYSVSHDLRAPLASILGIINIAEMENQTATQKEYLTMMRNSIKRLDGFIKDILDYSGNARKEICADQINFRELMVETQSNFAYMDAAGRVKIKTKINDTIPFHSDRARIAIVLNNLFSNAIKYQDFRKESPFLSMQIITTQENARIRVSDNGIGIEEKHQNKIFNMFYRASENSKGAGLGLYIVKEAVAKLGGTIKVQSEFGQFTAFDIVIPNLKPTKE